MSKIGDEMAFASVTTVRQESHIERDPDGEFPAILRPQQVIETTGGMTLRQHYAGLAMQGILSNPNCDGNRPLIVQAAVLNADALCKALEKKSP